MSSEEPNATRFEELMLLAEYMEMLAEAILIGHQELVASLERRITLLEAGLKKRSSP